MTANLGPLTTTFTPSTGDCFSSVFYGTNTIGDWLQLGLVTTTSCLPDNFGRDASLFYSPGICPSGYSYACTRATTSGSEDITIATCCPAGYYCQTSVETSQIFACLSYFPSAATLTIDSYNFIGPGSVDTSTTTVTVSSGETVRGYGPIVRRASSDPTWTNVLPSTTATAVPTASASPGSSATGTAAATGTAESSSSSSGLSTGAKAGIGVGVSVGFLLIVAACTLGYMFGKRASRRSGGGAQSEAAAGRGGKPKAGGELLGEQVQELSAAQARHELYPSQISELDGAQRK